ncbi:MAG: flippase-like domain-containing protein [Planctomycetes bacterium]|nr:flippase-like domain-containing protein [Planctomycetota bacterium]
MTGQRVRRFLFAFLRVAVSAGLIAYVFTYLIEYQDSVSLADGTVLVGRVREADEQSVRIETEDGEERVIPGALLARDGEEAPVHYGFFGVVARASLTPLLAGLAIYGIVNGFALIRWRLLLSSQGIAVRLRDIFRWHFIGLFYNAFLPGLTGGDLVKAYYVVRHAHGARAAAAVTVFIDRVIGILAMATLAGLVLLFYLGDPRLREAAIVIYVFLGSALTGAGLFFSKRVRRLVRLDKLIDLLPLSGLVRKVDEAVFLFRYRKRAVLSAFALSIVCDCVLVLVNYSYGQSLGIEGVGLGPYCVFIPTILILSAIPISVGGFGWGEAMYLHFFTAVAPAGAAASDLGNRAVAMSLLFRLTGVAWSLIGGVHLLLGEKRVTASEVKHEFEEPETPRGTESPAPPPPG